ATMRSRIGEPSPTSTNGCVVWHDSAHALTSNQCAARVCRYVDAFAASHDATLGWSLASGDAPAQAGATMIAASTRRLMSEMVVANGRGSGTGEMVMVRGRTNGTSVNVTNQSTTTFTSASRPPVHELGRRARRCTTVRPAMRDALASPRQQLRAEV